MKPINLEEAKAIDRIIELIASKEKFTYIEHKVICKLEGVNDSNHVAFLKMIEIELQGQATVNYGNGQIYTNNPGSFKRLLDNGGFSKIYEEDSKQKKEEERKSKLDTKQKSLSIESLEDSLRFSRSARRNSRIALGTSIGTAILTVAKLLYDILK